MLLRPGHGNVKQAIPFFLFALLQPVSISLRPGIFKAVPRFSLRVLPANPQTVFRRVRHRRRTFATFPLHSGNDRHRKLQALGRVRGHHLNTVALILVRKLRFLAGRVFHAFQINQKLIQRPARIPTPRQTQKLLHVIALHGTRLPTETRLRQNPRDQHIQRNHRLRHTPPLQIPQERTQFGGIVQGKSSQERGVKIHRIQPRNQRPPL